MSIKPGDVVQLKSGGPAMTVSKVGTLRGTPSAWCNWFEGVKIHSKAFSLASLIPHEDEEPPMGAIG